MKHRYLLLILLLSPSSRQGHALEAVQKQRSSLNKITDETDASENTKSKNPSSSFVDTPALKHNDPEDIQQNGPSFDLDAFFQEKPSSYPSKKKSFMKGLSNRVKRLFVSAANQPISEKDLTEDGFDFSSILDFYEKKQKEEETDNIKNMTNILENMKTTEEKRQYLIDLVKGTQFEGDAGAHMIEMIKHSKSDAPLFKGKWTNNVVHFLSNPFLVSFVSNVASVGTGNAQLGQGITALLSTTGGGPLRTLHNDTTVPTVLDQLVLSTQLIEKAAEIERNINSFPRNLFKTVFSAYKKNPSLDIVSENAQQIYDVLQKKNAEWEKKLQNLLEMVRKAQEKYPSLISPIVLSSLKESRSTNGTSQNNLLMKMKYEEDLKNQVETHLNKFLLSITDIVQKIYQTSQKEKKDASLERDRYGTSAAVGGIFGNMFADPLLDLGKNAISYGKNAGNKWLSYSQNSVSSKEPETEPETSSPDAKNKEETIVQEKSPAQNNTESENKTYNSPQPEEEKKKEKISEEAEEEARKREDEKQKERDRMRKEEESLRKKLEKEAEEKRLKEEEARKQEEERQRLEKETEEKRIREEEARNREDERQRLKKEAEEKRIREEEARKREEEKQKERDRMRKEEESLRKKLEKEAEEKRIREEEARKREELKKATLPPKKHHLRREDG